MDDEGNIRIATDGDGTCFDWLDRGRADDEAGDVDCDDGADAVAGDVAVEDGCDCDDDVAAAREETRMCGE